jgi:hypothetical protein
MMVELLRRPVQLRLFTDSRTLFDSITSMRPMTETQLLLYIVRLRKAYRNGDLASLAWSRTRFIIAEAPIKENSYQALSDW